MDTLCLSESLLDRMPRTKRRAAPRADFRSGHHRRPPRASVASPLSQPSLPAGSQYWMMSPRDVAMTCSVPVPRQQTGLSSEQPLGRPACALETAAPTPSRWNTLVQGRQKVSSAHWGKPALALNHCTRRHAESVTRAPRDASFRASGQQVVQNLTGCILASAGEVCAPHTLVIGQLRIPPHEVHTDEPPDHHRNAGLLQLRVRT